ncbi:hypothetical protein FJQ54_10815 [Sandaracinobacter neustonicus]|uniref:Lipoprotein n=1 Tax=Sandaracinobacter neustonicus TaxID=1715348 RepID=A0A501XJA6_9SPHN|nr:hypothetical protein [Sandaracinobacter neustonicus]TPE60489.1 hypothetical protein FJQ54_10815 [Sandaracinobacter neustonicus]
MPYLHAPLVRRVGPALLLALLAGCSAQPPSGPAANLAACQPLGDGSPDFSGGEDAAAAPGGLIVSFDDRRGGGRGSLRLLTDGAAGVALSDDLTGGVPARFHPHGIGTVETADGLWVMAVNHPDGWDGASSTVEVFQWSGGRLLHRRSVSLPGFQRLNDVLPVSAYAFYATNESRAAHGAARELLTYLLKRGDGSLLFHDGQATREVLGGFAFANSVERSGAETLAVSDSIKGQVLLLQGDIGSGRVHLAQTLDSGEGPDNLTRQADGNLLLARHDRLREFAQHAAGKSAVSPWSLARISPETGAVTTLVVSDGVEAPAVPVASMLPSGRVFLGSVFGRSYVCAAGALGMSKSTNTP